MNKKCSKCKTAKPVSEFRKMSGRKSLHCWCNQCCADYSRQWQKQNKEKARASTSKYQKTQKGKLTLKNAARRRREIAPVKPNDRLKLRARQKARQAFDSGKIIKQPCEVCGDTSVQMHHDDYTKPLEVRFFCKKHHLLLHGMVQVQSG